MKNIILSLVLGMIAPAAYGYGGGEDFPFRCEGPEDTDVKYFDIVPDFDSITGYELRFTLRSGLKGSFSVEITESEDRHYYIVKGSVWTPLVIFERHIVAHIAKAPGDTSKAGTQLTFPGMNPNYGDHLGDTLCFAQ